MNTIEHVFVLMLENRSFDHFFGLSGYPNVSRPPDPRFQPGAIDRLASDPEHEYAQVNAQINGGKMDGFKAGEPWLGFQREQLPVVSGLADQFLLFDNWFSSVPGPTWPNRFFVHAASSGGLATSPHGIDSAEAVILPSKAFHFEHGSVFDKLEAAGKRWRVYHGDHTPQVLAVQGMVQRFLDNGDQFRAFQDASPAAGFATDLASGNYDVDYTFIEPNYGLALLAPFAKGNSQHPTGAVSAGEALIKAVYEAIRSSSVWTKSALLVLWDEHGGFYDHAKPEPATPPDDAPLNVNRGPAAVPPFSFDRLGVRVPALLVSPWVGHQIGSEAFPGKHFDHASVIASLRSLWWPKGEPLNPRDRDATTWTDALLPAPRQDCPTSLPDALDQSPTDGPGAFGEGFLDGISLIAADLDAALSQKTGAPPIAALPEQRSALLSLTSRVAGELTADRDAKLLRYIEAVQRRVAEHKRKVRQR
jgi:phospholipase C